MEEQDITYQNWKKTLLLDIWFEQNNQDTLKLFFRYDIHRYLLLFTISISFWSVQQASAI